MSRKKKAGISLLRASLICAGLNAIIAAVIAVESDVSDPQLAVAHAGFGLVVGAGTALLIGYLIRKAHSFGFVTAAGILITLLIITTYTATNTENIALAATMALAVPLYTVAAFITCLLVRPIHHDR